MWLPDGRDRLTRRYQSIAHPIRRVLLSSLLAPSATYCGRQSMSSLVCRAAVAPPQAIVKMPSSVAMATETIPGTPVLPNQRPRTDPRLMAVTATALRTPFLERYRKTAEMTTETGTVPPAANARRLLRYQSLPARELPRPSLPSPADLSVTTRRSRSVSYPHFHQQVAFRNTVFFMQTHKPYPAVFHFSQLHTERLAWQQGMQKLQFTYANNPPSGQCGGNGLQNVINNHHARHNRMSGEMPRQSGMVGGNMKQHRANGQSGEHQDLRL